jgi:membrane carboxypeptidase/penicillin-binding protein
MFKNDSNAYRGSLNVIDAIKRSSNVIAVQATNVIGLQNIKKYFQDTLNLTYSQAQKMFPYYQYSIALGAVELTPLELNQLYQVVANDGILKRLYFISKIQNIKGRIIYEQNTQEFRQIVSKEASFLIKSILKQVMQPGGSGSRVQRQFNFKVDIAGKSGTTQHNRDVWFSGFTNTLSTTVWIGQDHNKVLGRHFYGGIQAGNIFGGLMKYGLRFYPSTRFIADSSYNFSKSSIDLLTGKLPNKETLFSTQGIFITGTQPKDTTSLSKEEQIKIAVKKRLLTNTQEQRILQKQEKEDEEEEQADNSIQKRE